MSESYSFIVLPLIVLPVIALPVIVWRNGSVLKLTEHLLIAATKNLAE